MEIYNQAKLWLAVKVTGLTGTMECAFFFALLAAFGFPGSHATMPQYIQWFSTTFLQLVMLPVLSAGQNAHAASVADLHRKFDTHIAKKRAITARMHQQKDPKTGRFIKKGSTV